MKWGHKFVDGKKTPSWRFHRVKQGVIILVIIFVSCGATALTLAGGSVSTMIDALSQQLTGADAATIRNGVAMGAANKARNSVKKTPAKRSTTNMTGLDMSNTNCATSATKTAGLTGSYMPQLQKLAEYELVCGGTVTSTMMIFTGMPKDTNEAIDMAQGMASDLKEFARFGIRPLVILEPTSSEGNINFAKYRAGSHDALMEQYFAEIKQQGVSDRQMGTWVPFPEPNIPLWDDTTIEDLTANIIKTVTIQKKYFPGSKASIMLDSMSYPSGSHSWDNGGYTSLLPYVQNIPKGLIDSFGYQGFPWSPPTTQGGLAGANLEAKQFVQAKLAVEAARALGITDVWLNTGSFGRSYSNDAKQTVIVDPDTRSKILQGVIEQAKAVKASGFHVAINLFAEDKGALAEGNDWSYWSSGQTSNSEATTVFKAFAANTRSNGLDLWIFDQTH